MLEASDTMPVAMSKRDGRSFFDQLAVDPSFQTLFGRPYVTNDELCDPMICGEALRGSDPLTVEDIETFAFDDISSSGCLVPVSPCWLGFLHCAVRHG